MTDHRFVLAAVLVVLGASGASGADKKVQMKDLPAPVQQVVREQTKGAATVGLSEEREGGRVFYEVETKVNGRTRDLLVDSAGAIVEIEEEVLLDAVPPAVRSAFTAAGKVLKVEAVTKGTTVTYEAQVVLTFNAPGRTGMVEKLELLREQAGTDIRPAAQFDKPSVA